MWKVLMVLLVALGLSGCAMQTDVNNQIAASNASRFEAYKDGMVGCGSDESCKLGLSMAFAAGLGQQQLYREESVTDYMKALMPFAAMGVDLTKTFYSGGDGGSSTGLIVRGNYNTVTGIGNRSEADGGSTIGQSWTSSVENSTSMYNKTYTLAYDGEIASQEDLLKTYSLEPVE